jgi:hypothetical protein
MTPRQHDQAAGQVVLELELREAGVALHTSWRFIQPPAPAPPVVVRVPAILDSVIDSLRAAAEALNDGDPEPFASLFAADAEWRGVSRGHLWWKRAPS